MKIPGVTEEDIRAELTKGPLKALLAGGSIQVVSSSVNFLTTSSIHGAFLNNAGISTSDASTNSLVQANWFINATTGSDTNDGSSSGAALKTFAELSRRWGKGNLLNPTGGTVTVNIMTDLPSTDPIAFDIRLASGVGLLISGEAGVTTLYTGTLSGVVAKNRATNTPLQGTDGYVTGGWASYIPTIASANPARILDTTNGSQFYAVKDLGGGAARFSEPIKPVTVIASAFPRFINNAARPTSAVANSDSFQLQSLPKVFWGSVKVDSAYSSASGTGVSSNVGYQGLHFDRIGATNGPPVQPNTQNSVVHKFYSCIISVQYQCVGAIPDPAFNNCAFRQTGQIFSGQGGVVSLLAGVVFGTVGNFGQNHIFDMDVMFQGGIIGNNNMAFKIGTLAIFDTPVLGTSNNNKTGDGLHVGPGSNMWLQTFLDTTGHALWGSGNAGAGVFVAPGGTFNYSATAPTITGSTPGTNDFNLAGATTSRAWDETANAGAGGWTTLITNSWANLTTAIASSGLGDAATNVGKGARMVKAAT